MAHPIERLRWVARAEGAGPGVLAREAAVALASGGGDGAGMVTGCRRLVDRHTIAGPIWWLAAKVLVANDPSAEAWAAAAQLEADPTSQVLAAQLADDVTVTVIGWPEQASEALRRRGDVEVLVVECNGDGRALARRLDAAGVEAFDVPEAGLGAAVRESGLVLLEASALGPDGFLAQSGSLAAAAVARSLGIDVWVVAGVGRVLPARLWQALVERLADTDDAWALPDEVVPLEWATSVVGPQGVEPAADAWKRADCPVAPELLRFAG